MGVVLSALILGISNVPSSSNAALAAGNKTEWILTEICPDTGTHIVYITHDAAKIVSYKYGYHVSISAPTWLVYCYRPKEKVEWVSKLDAFNGRLLMSPFADCGMNKVGVKVTGTGTSDGQKERLKDLLDGIGLSSEVTGTNKKKAAGSKSTKEKH